MPIPSGATLRLVFEDTEFSVSCVIDSFVESAFKGSNPREDQVAAVLESYVRSDEPGHAEPTHFLFFHVDKPGYAIFCARVGDGVLQSTVYGAAFTDFSPGEPPVVTRPSPALYFTV